MPAEVDLLPRFAKFLLDHVTPASGGSAFLLGVSGGPDSVAMLDLFDRLRRGECGAFSDAKIAVATFDHQLRPSSRNEVEFVRRICELRSVPFFEGVGNVREFAKREGLSVEEAGRVLRYNFFEDVARTWGASYICTAHTADDLLETMVLRLTKGTGPFGLGSIRPLTGVYLRPLLFFSKQEILSYLRSRSLEYVVDESNFDETFQRNLVRLRVMPVLRSINPGVERAALRLATSLWELENYVGRVLEPYLGSVKASGDRIFFKIPEDPYLKVELVRRLVQKYLRKSVDSEKLTRLARCQRTSFKVSLWGSVGVEVSHGWGMLGDIHNFPNLEVRLNPGESVHSLGGYFIKVSLRDIISDKVVLRSWRNGDRTRSGKKVKEIFAEAKVPTFARRLLPLIEVNGAVCWIAKHFEDTELTAKIGLKIQLEGGLTFEP